MKYERKQIVNGVFWSGIDKLGVVVIQLLLEIILARHLLPKDYGIVGMATIFVTFGLLFSEGGFSNALIQKQDRTETDLSTAFYFNLGCSLLVVLAVFLIAPYASHFFKTPALTNVLRVLSVGIMFNSIVMVHKTILTIRMDFKTQAKISFIALLVSGCIGVYLAVKGFGVWSLVAQILSQSFTAAVLLFIVVKRVPLQSFSTASLKKLFTFGSKILAAGVLQSIYTNLYYLFIGRRMSASTLGIYTKANQFTFMPASLISGVLQRVMFPFFSASQEDSAKLHKLNQDFTALICITIFPVFIYFYLLAEPLVYYGLSIKWIAIVPIVKILSLAVLLYPVTVNNMILFQVKNRPSYFLYLEIASKFIGITIFFITIDHGIVALCWGIVIHQVLHFFISSLCVQQLLRKPLFDQVSVVMPYMVIAAAAWLPFRLVHYQLGGDHLAFLFIGSTIFIFYYAAIYFIFFRDRLRSIIKLLSK